MSSQTISEHLTDNIQQLSKDETMINILRAIIDRYGNNNELYVPKNIYSDAGRSVTVTPTPSGDGVTLKIL